MRPLFIALAFLVAAASCGGTSLVRTSKEPRRPIKHPSEVAIISQPPVDRAYRDVGVFTYGGMRWESDAKFTDKLRNAAAEEGCDAILVVPGDPNSPSCLYYDEPDPPRSRAAAAPSESDAGTD